MMWKEYLHDVSNECQFESPATETEIASIKKELGMDLPNQLAALYNETNGVFGNYGISFVWSTEQIVRENLFLRSLQEEQDFMQPVDHFLFFSDAGNGDLFAYLRENDTTWNENIYVWDHEDDSRRPIAPSIETFLKGWITGEISV